MKQWKRGNADAIANVKTIHAIFCYIYAYSAFVEIGHQVRQTRKYSSQFYWLFDIICTNETILRIFEYDKRLRNTFVADSSQKVNLK